MQTEKNSVSGYSFICEKNDSVNSGDIYDYLGLARAFKGRIEEYVPPPPESEQLSGEVYTESCEICGGRSRRDVDHLEDLVQRCALTNSPHPTFFLHKHWPQFADFNRLMQFHCSICELHFRGSRAFAVHLYNSQLESMDGSAEEQVHQIEKEPLQDDKKDGDSDTGEEEEKVNHDISKTEDEGHPEENNKDTKLECPTDVEGKDLTDLAEGEVSTVECVDPKCKSPKENSHKPELQEQSSQGEPKKSKKQKLFEMKEKHIQLYQQFLAFLKEVSDKVPTAEMMPKLQPFLCSQGPEFYKIAYLTGAYEKNETESKGNYDTSCVDYMELTRKLLSAQGEETGSCEPITTREENMKEQQHKDESNSSTVEMESFPLSKVKSFYGPLASRMRMSQVLMNRLDELHPKLCMEHLLLTDREFQDQHFDNPFRPEISKRTAIMKCMSCEESIHSVRHHINEVMWNYWPSSTQYIKLSTGEKEPSDVPLAMATPGSHLSHLLRLPGNRHMPATIFCPVCGIHFSNNRPFIFLIYHLRFHVGMTRDVANVWPNEFVMQHARLMIEITDILVGRIVGDISVKKATSLFMEKFSCHNGGSYRSRPVNLLPQKSVAGPRTKTAGKGRVRGRAGGKRPKGEDFHNTSAGPVQKRPRTNNPPIRNDSITGTAAHVSGQRSLLPSASSAGSFNRPVHQYSNNRPAVPRPEMVLWNAPVGNISQFTPALVVRDSLISTPLRRDRAMMCELCNTPVDGERGLHIHLLQALFRMRSRPDGQRIAERHLMCFPGVFVYRHRAMCPACNLGLKSFDACMSHINLAPGEHHRQLERDIVAVYIDCMKHRINLDNVISFLKSRFCIE